MSSIKVISDFITKIIRKNILFAITVIIINYHLIQRWTHISNRGISFNDYLSLSVYTCMTISILTMLNVIFYMRKSYDTVKILCRNNFDYFLGVSVAVTRNNFIFCCIPIIYAIAYSSLIRTLSIVTIKSTIFILIFEWFLPLTILSIVISFISVIINNLILKITLSSVFLYLTSTKMLDRVIDIKEPFFKALFKSLNIFEDQSYAYYSDFVGKVNNSAYVIDKIIPTLFAITLIIVAYLILNDIRKKQIKSLIVIVVYSILFIGLNYISIDMSTYRDEERSYGEYLKKYNISDIKIKSHDMKIDFKSKSNIKDRIVLLNTSNEELTNINMILDEIFDIKYIKVNSENIKFNIKKDLIEVNLKESLEPNDEVTLDIEYEGYINVLTSWNQNKYIATKDDIMLPPGSLAWYPKVNQSSCMAYKINLSSKSNVYSNLPLLNKTSNFFKKDYIFEGKSNDIAIYAGEFKEEVKDDIKIIYPSDSNVNMDIEEKIKFLIETRNEILGDSKASVDAKKYVDEVDNVMESIKRKKINMILVADLPSNEFLYEDSKGEKISITIYHWLSGNILIIDK